MKILIENTCVILRSKAREVVSAALGLLKVILSVFPNTSLAQFLQDIVSSPIYIAGQVFGDILNKILVVHEIGLQEPIPVAWNFNV